MSFSAGVGQVASRDTKLTCISNMVAKSDSPFLKIKWTIRKSGSFLLPLGVLSVFGLAINYYHISFIYSSFATCHRKTNVVFLKTHKCAGSSIQNIMMRFGDIHNLTFVLPVNNNYLGHPTPFNKSMVQKPLFAKYNLLVHHTRLNYTAIRNLMPPDTVFVTAIRDPVNLFESSFGYFDLGKFYNNSLSNFISETRRGDPKTANRSGGKFGVNQMMFDLGADPLIFYNDSLIQNYVTKLESWFDLVMVAERMDESLILLKELLCWDVDDVITFELNARSSTFKQNLTTEEAQGIRELNRADQILYDHFVAKFDRVVEAFGRDRMANEVFELRQRTKEWQDFCVYKQTTHHTTDKKYYINPKVLFLQSSNQQNYTCQALVAQELPYTDMLRQKQMARLAKRKLAKPQKKYARARRISRVQARL